MFSDLVDFSTEKDYYAVLDVSVHATDVEIKKAFRDMSRQLHPDVCKLPDSTERFQSISGMVS